MFDVIKEARENGIPVAISTGVPTGRMFPFAATKGSPRSLKQIGFVLGDNMNPQKARGLLMALTKARETQGLQKYFDY